MDKVVSGLRACPARIVCRTARAEQWWRGLDSNQRTLARADLQSAAFNHSATSPRCRQARHMAAHRDGVNALLESQRRRPSLRSGAPKFNRAPRDHILERVKGIEPSS